MGFQVPYRALEVLEVPRGTRGLVGREEKHLLGRKQPEPPLEWCRNLPAEFGGGDLAMAG